MSEIEGPRRRVLVAGSTGYLGRFVCRELATRGHFVRALARSPERLEPLRDALDEVVEAEVTRPETLAGACDGIEVVFSSVGITRQRDGLTFRDVDYRGNRNLLDEARRAGVRRFVYVSLLHGRRLRHLAIVDAHEAFVDELATSGLDSVVMRPTGYFSDLEEILRMARRGRVWLLGPGTARVNPIHGADLAVACAEAVGEAPGPEPATRDVEVGGPETHTWNEIAALALEVAGRPARGSRTSISRVPAGLARSAARLVRVFDRHRGELLAFFVAMATMDVVAPSRGVLTLEAHYRSLAADA